MGLVPIIWAMGCIRLMDAESQVRVAVIPVWFTRANHARLHDAAHENALLWNKLVRWVHVEWAKGRHSLSKRDIRDHADSFNSTIPLHSHTIQATAEDLYDAIVTSRVNRRNGMRVRAPWREKVYRPLVFSHNFGWRETAEGKLALSFGRGQKRVVVPMPTVVDARTGLPVPNRLWGEITLCWNRDAREWAFHIPYETSMVLGLPHAQPGTDGSYPASTVTVAVDEGIINPMALSVRDTETNTVDALVISGRQIRSIKRQRNKTVGSLQKALSKTKPGSRKRKKLAAKLKDTRAKTDRQLRNADHHVAKRASDWARTQAVDTTTGEIRPVRLVVGDVRGIEQRTKQRRHARKNQRQQLSQWSRGRQEQYMSEKTGLPIEHVPEHHTTQTCPKCSARLKPLGRTYSCKNPDCGLTLHRDVVGTGNIGSRAEHGGTNASKNTPIVPWIDDDTTITVTYQRAITGWTTEQSATHSRHQHARSQVGGKHVVEAQNRARHTSITGSSVAEHQHVSQPAANPSGHADEERSTLLTATRHAQLRSPVLSASAGRGGSLHFYRSVE